MPRKRPRILLVEDNYERAAWIRSTGPDVLWDHASGTRQALHKVNQMALGQIEAYDAVFLDFDLGVTGGGGEKVAYKLVEVGYLGVVVVHSANPAGGPAMVSYIGHLTRPFGRTPIYAPAFDQRSEKIWRWVVSRLGG